MITDKTTLVILAREYSDDIGEQLISYAKFFKYVICVTSKESEVVPQKDNIKYYFFKFENNFSDLRNFAISKVKTEWVFFLDADETISPQLRTFLEKIDIVDSIDGYWFSRRTYISDSVYLKHGLFYPDFQLRLFKIKPEYRYSGSIHELVTIPHGKTTEVNQDLYHYPENPKYTRFSDFHNLMPYIAIHAAFIQAQQKHKNIFSLLGLLIKGTRVGLTMFVAGYTRGKGFLDGWAGLRAHLLFSSSITLAYWKAFYSEIHLK